MTEFSRQSLKVGNGECVVIDSYIEMIIRKIFSRENLLALLLCLILILTIVSTSDQSPNWIYQGF